MNRHEERFSLDGAWKLAWVKNEEYVKDQPDLSTPFSVEKTGYPVIDAVVPGNYELDLMRAGLLDDPYFGTNHHKMRPYESLHFIWFRSFEYDREPDANAMLCFEGVDTFADVYLNGVQVGETDNMLIPHEFSCPTLARGTNTIVVHIRPTVIEARKYKLPVSSSALKYNYDSLYVRKAPHMFGWDIMPRLVSGGIWRPAYIERRLPDRIDELFAVTTGVDLDRRTAALQFFYNLSVKGDDIAEYSLRVTGVCGESGFKLEQKLWHTSGKCGTTVQNCRFWWPRNYGSPDLYEVEAELVRNGATVARATLSVGLRTVSLERTSLAGEDGDFGFRVNGKRVFILGTNWVPADALHSRDAERLPEILPMLNELGCNAVRCWGGNVYENDYFYDFCDRNGVLIWQDFTLACAINPQERRFEDMLAREAEIIIKRLRNHPSLLMWAGDNECDLAFRGWTGWKRDPNKNVLTRRVLPEALWAHDYTRPYIPSSPYIDSRAYEEGGAISEEHLWGPRDYFKSDFYTKSKCHFVSETGYHACPSPESLRKFLSPDKVYPWRDASGRPNDEWTAHASAMVSEGDPYEYRIALMAKQINVLFGDSVPDNIDDFSLASQISQAEANKYFIERFRVTKWRRTGIIWWNLIDGWPQFSDAVVDYYYNKKLAYYYTIRSQRPVCLIFDEPENGIITLHAVNDMMKGVDSDVNGDGKWDTKNDIYGIAMQPTEESSTALMTGMGMSLCSVSSDGKSISATAAGDKKLLSSIDKMKSFAHKITFDTQNDIINITFKSDRALFLQHKLETAGVHLRDMESDYLILPDPKYDEAQDNYFSMVSKHCRSFVSVPVNADAEITGLVTEALARYSNEYLRPQAFDTLYREKTSRDVRTSDMLNIILSNNYIDFALLYSFGAIDSALNNAVFNDAPFASTVEAGVGKVEQDILNFTEGWKGKLSPTEK